MNDNALNGSHLHPRSDAVAPGVGIEPTRRAGQKVVYVASSEGTRPLVGRSLFSDVGGEDASSQIRGPPGFLRCCGLDAWPTQTSSDRLMFVWAGAVMLCQYRLFVLVLERHDIGVARGYGHVCSW